MIGKREHRTARWSILGPDPARRVDEAECAISVLLAIAFAQLVPAHNVSWAAFSGYMVMRGHVADTLWRAVLRIIGTAIGAGLALLWVPQLHGAPLSASVASALVGGLTLYGSLTGRRAYAWLFVGLTFEMILYDGLEHPGHDALAFARSRMLEVGVGTLACVIVSALSAVTLRRIWPAARGPEARRLGWHPHAARHAAEAAVALAVLPFIGRLWAVPELAQAAVSIMAVMLVPVTSLGASGLVPVSRRLVQRVAGCLAGAALSFLVLLAAGGSAVLLLAGVAIGVLIGRHIENGKHAVPYIGTQFTLAVLVTLVPDTFGEAAIAPALDRLVGILLGMALLEPVLVAWHLLFPAARRVLVARHAAPDAPR